LVIGSERSTPYGNGAGQLLCAIARHIVLCDGDGCTSSDLALFTYRNRRRPLYPFETA
jgi:hypothetical protein